VSSGSGFSASDRIRCIMLWTCPFSAFPFPVAARLITLGGYSATPRPDIWATRIRDARVEDGKLHFHIYNEAVVLFSPVMELDASHYSKLILRINATGTENLKVGLLWSDTTSFDDSSPRIIEDFVLEDGFNNIEIDLSSDPEGEWQGTVKRLRLALTTGNDVDVEIDEIKLLKE